MRRVDSQFFSSGERNRDSLGDYAITPGRRHHLSWNRIQCYSSGHAGRCGGQVRSDISGARSVWQTANHFVSNGAQRSGAGFLSLGGLVTLLQAATGPVAECTRKVPAAGPRAGGTQLRLGGDLGRFYSTAQHWVFVNRRSEVRDHSALWGIERKRARIYQKYGIPRILLRYAKWGYQGEVFRGGVHRSRNRSQPAPQIVS